MEDVLDLYAEPLDESRPVVCLDESPFQLLAHAREPEPAAPGKPRREDYEYVRAGVADVMMICQPAAGLRTRLVMDSKKKRDFARSCAHVESLFPRAEKIRLVCDNLSTHTKGAFYLAFDPSTARRMAAKFEIHYTPKHGSWLNIAELEFAVLGRTVFKKRIESPGRLSSELDAQCASRNQEGKPVKWMFTSEKAREKMGSAYGMVASRST